MNDNKPGLADYMLAVMHQIMDKAAVEKEITEKEKEKIPNLSAVMPGTPKIVWNP